MVKLIRYFKELLCKHDWIRLDNDPIPKMESGTTLYMSRLHRCSKCDMETMLGSGGIEF